MGDAGIWTVVGALGELVGGVAVVVSLLYLAVQIRQNSRMVRGTSVQAITQTIQTELRWSSDLGSAFVKMIEDPDALTRAEAFQIGEWMTAAMMARQNELIQFEQGLIDRQTWQGCEGILRSMLSLSWCRTWWASFDKTTFNAAFLSLVDGVLAEDRSFDYETYVRRIHSREP